MTLPRSVVWALWLALYAATTMLLYFVSDLPDIRVSHAVLAYMVLIIFASRHGGRALAITMVTLGYLSVDWLFVPPRFALGDATELDWIVLIGFGITGWLMSELFASQREATRIAEERTREVERLSAERLQLERAASTARVLEEADRLKNALLSSLAHDLRSPIATLSLLADPAAGFSGAASLQRVSEEAERLSDYIATLQRFASDSGGRALRVERHDALDLIQATLRSSEALLTGREVRVAPVATSFAVRCDFTLSVQVLANLLQNAVRYSPPSEPIDIMVYADEAMASMIRIAVADRGPGVREDAVDGLFMPMPRRSAVTLAAPEDTGERMGMGLSIARTFARAQRGDVSYRARGGGGAEFSFALPTATEP